MKLFFKILLVCMCILPVGILFAGCGEDAYTLVSGVDFSKEEIYLSVGQSAKLSYKVYPSSSDNQDVNFSSSNEGVVSVDAEGNVNLKDNGEAVITIRTVDGGYIDSCKVIALIDPASICFDTSRNNMKVEYKESNPTEVDYYYTYISVGEVKKLSLNFLNSEETEDETITNRNVVFTSANTKNVNVINESSGVIKGISNVVYDVSDNRGPYSEVTATLTVTNTGANISTKIRVYVTDFTSSSNLFVSTYSGGDIEKYGNVYLSSSNSSGEFFKAYLLDFANYISEFDIFLESSDPEIFEVENVQNEDLPNPLEPTETLSEEDIAKFKFFKLISKEKEGTAYLYITISSSDENGYQIRTYLNIIVEADVTNATISSGTSTSVQQGETVYETLSKDEFFSLDATYFGTKESVQVELQNVERTNRYAIPESLDGTVIKCFGTKKSSSYINTILYNIYDENNFKIIGATSAKCNILVIIPKTRSEVKEEIHASYEFYIQDRLDGILVTGDLTGIGITEVNMDRLATKTLDINTFSLLGSSGNPVSVSVSTSGTPFDTTSYANIGTISGDGAQLIITNNSIGVNTITISATDGNIVVYYTINVYRTTNP